jgi:integrase
VPTSCGLSGESFSAGADVPNLSHPPQRSDMRLSEHIEPFVIARGYAPSSARQRRVLLRRFCAEVGDVATTAAVHAWWAAIAHLSPASRHANLCAVRQFCGYLRAVEVLVGDPTAALRSPRVEAGPPVVLTQRDAMAVLAAAADPLERCAIALMLGCGLRVGDVRNLDVVDVDPVQRLVRVRSKGAKVRVVPMPELVTELVAVQCAIVGDGPLMQTSRSRGRLASSTLQQRVSRALYRAGVKRAPGDNRSSHVLRRTCATELLMGGTATITDVQAILGHASLQSTSRYLARPDAARLLAVIESGPLGRAA